MSNPNPPEDALANASHEEIMSAMFANMVVQQANLALMMMGKVPDPQSGQRVQDLDAAQMFIEQLEMLAVKTKGNLDAQEEKLLRQSLAATRMAFVEAVEGKPEHEPVHPASGPAVAATPPTPTTSATAASPFAAETAAAVSEESRKKFSKKY